MSSDLHTYLRTSKGVLEQGNMIKYLKGTRYVYDNRVIYYITEKKNTSL